MSIRHQAAMTALILFLFGVALVLSVHLAQAQEPAPPPNRPAPPVSPISPISPIISMWIPVVYR